MKKVLIMVVSSMDGFYKPLFEASKETWDTVQVDGVETIFYFGKTDVKTIHNNALFLPYDETLHNMGRKTIAAYEWVLQHKEFDYVARVNASTYVDKVKLIDYIQSLPDTNCFAGLEVAASNGQDRWMWGPQFILSRDLIQLIVDNKEKWNHSVMDDNATSQLLNKFNTPYTQGRAVSIEKKDHGYLALCYGSNSFNFNDFSDLKQMDNQFFIRVKQDHDRTQDVYLMNEIFNAIK